MINNSELKNIRGGISFTAALMAAISKNITTILNLGQTLGSALRRILRKNYC